MASEKSGWMVATSYFLRHRIINIDDVLGALVAFSRCLTSLTRSVLRKDWHICAGDTGGIPLVSRDKSRLGLRRINRYPHLERFYDRDGTCERVYVYVYQVELLPMGPLDTRRSRFRERTICGLYSAIDRRLFALPSVTIESAEIAS